MITSSIVYVAVVLLISTASRANAQNILRLGECTTPNQERASCIELQQCTFLYNLIASPQLKEEDKIFLRRSQCGTIDGKILVCCPDRYMEAPQPQIRARVSVPEPGTCGRVIDNRIYGGNRTTIDEFPWMALIEYDKGNGVVGHHCGGSLISDRYILTAAHCVVPGVIPETWKPIQVRLGEWNTSTDPDCSVDARGAQDCADPHVDIPIQQAIAHPNYVSTAKNQLYDIALLRLSRSVSFTDFIRPICLPIKDSLKDISFDGVIMDVAGWGKTEQGTTSNLKLKAAVPGIPSTDCRPVYARRNIQIQNSQMCAGGQKGIDSCNGDSGGGLVALDSSNKAAVYYYIAGVISFGPTPCGLQGWPGVYTKVSSYIDWILQNIQ